MPPTDRRSPPSSRADAAPPSTARPTLHSIPGGVPRARSSGEGGGGGGEHERRISFLEDGHDDLRELLREIASKQDQTLATLGREPSHLDKDDRGEGLLGVVATMCRDRADWERTRGRFWAIVGGVGALGGAISVVLHLMRR